jgi:hypothetical protein
MLDDCGLFTAEDVDRVTGDAERDYRQRRCAPVPLAVLGMIASGWVARRPRRLHSRGCRCHGALCCARCRGFYNPRPKEQDARDWRAIRSEARLIVVQNAATAHDPGRMLTATAKRPSSGRPIAAGDDCGISEGPRRPGCPDSLVIAIDFTSRLGRQIPAERAISPPTHQPAAPSARETSSTTRTRVIGSVSSPPSESGIQRRKRPACVIASNSGSGSRRDCSMSSAQDRISGANPAAASTNDDCAASDMEFRPRRFMPGPCHAVMTAWAVSGKVGSFAWGDPAALGAAVAHVRS